MIKISDLIQRLQEIQQKYGDLPVVEDINVGDDISYHYYHSQQSVSVARFCYFDRENLQNFYVTTFDMKIDVPSDFLAVVI